MAESKLEQQWVEIFRSGNYGGKGSYSPSDLDHVVEEYNPGFHEAPVVIGHPETNSPAFGWVEKLKRVGDRLLAKLAQVDPAFERMVGEGKFKKRSASFYRRPDGLSLRHVGFLGAQPPDVKGLADVKFEDGAAASIVAFEEESDMGSNFVGRFLAQQSASILNFAESDGPDGQWLKIFSAGDSWGDSKLTRDDLDSVVSNYKPGQASVGVGSVGLPDALAKAPSHGEVAAVRRDGNDLLAKIGKVDPRVTELQKAGAFKKLAVSLKKTPSGLSLQRVGFVAPHYPDGVTGEKTLDELHGAHSQTKDVVFMETSSAPVVTGRLRVDPNSVRLRDLAQQRAREGHVSFAEALTKVAIECPALVQPAYRRLAPDPRSVELSDLAKQRAREERISFAEALTEVAQERPDLT